MMRIDSVNNFDQNNLTLLRLFSSMASLFLLDFNCNCLHHEQLECIIKNVTF